MSRHPVGDSIRPVSITTPRCEQHGAFATLACERCGAAGCQMCSKPALGKHYCATCRKRYRYLRGFFLARVSVLLTVLLLVLLYGHGDLRSRRARTDWQQTLSVAVVLVTEGPVKASAIAQFKRRLPVLEERLANEFSRHREGPRPFRFVLYGPVQGEKPPALPAGNGLTDLLAHRYRQWRYLSKLDEASALDGSRYDSRIYVVARPAKRPDVQFVEGHSDQGGRVGVIEVELESAMVDMVLSVVAHELFHTLGAEDKYDAHGRTLVPEGLAEPDLTPLLPQRYIEVMARNRPIAEGHEIQMNSLAELRVGPITAREVHWK